MQATWQSSKLTHKNLVPALRACGLALMTVGTPDFTLRYLSRDSLPRIALRQHKGYFLRFTFTDVVELKHQRVCLSTVRARMASQIVNEAGNILPPRLAPSPHDILAMALAAIPIPVGLRTTLAVFTLRLQTVRATTINAERSGV